MKTHHVVRPLSGCRPVRAMVVMALGLGLAGGCDGDGGVQPPSLRFGQVGEVQVTVTTPLSLGSGRLEQTLTWQSTGAWQLVESISYRGLPGDESLRRNEGDPGAYAAAYASLITQVNETPSLDLFVPELDPDLTPTCSSSSSTVLFRIRDDRRGQSEEWIRCGQGSLSFLSPLGAGPDIAASRVVQAAILARDFTLGDDFLSEYLGSLPFGTLDRGEASKADLEGPRAFFGPPGTDPWITEPAGWAAFWAEHTGGSLEPPLVDWAVDMVVVGAVGLRFEAGDSVEVRRILRVGNGTHVELVERVPGDFCAPASRAQIPFHIVVAPLSPPAILFLTPEVERVPCGT